MPTEQQVETFAKLMHQRLKDSDIEYCRMFAKEHLTATEISAELVTPAPAEQSTLSNTLAEIQEALDALEDEVDEATLREIADDLREVADETVLEIVANIAAKSGELVDADQWDYDNGKIIGAGLVRQRIIEALAAL